MKIFIILLMPIVMSLSVVAEEKAAEVEQIQLSVHAAALPTPAMRFHFLPDLVDQTEGNAALLYLNAAQQVAIARAGDASRQADDEKIWRWIATPIAELPIGEVQGLLNRYAGAMNQMRLAARRDRCDFDPPFRTEGFRTLLPYLVDARALARLACLGARVKMARGDFDGAVADLSLPIAQSGHLNEGQPILIQLLVAASCGQLAIDQVQTMMALEHSPNLYWALGDVPSPLANVRGIMQMERAGAYFSIPQLKDARAGKLTAEQWRAALNTMTEIRGGLHSYGQPGGAAQLNAMLVAVKEYPAAKQYLLEQKFSSSQIEAMSATQVLGLYHVGEFEYWTQELDKSLTLPYWQALPLISRTEEQMRQRTSDSPWSLLGTFAPEIKTSLTNLARADRRIALLRTVEAVRAYAAEHDGQVPARLEDLRDTPAPLDPMTGQKFKYQTDGQLVTIEGPAMGTVGPEPTGIRIILTVSK